MRIYSTIRKGSLHPVFCEDYMVSTFIEDKFYVGAVFDGATTGVDTHFSSALMGKILKAACKSLPYQAHHGEVRINLDFATAADIARYLTKAVFDGLNRHRNQLMLERNELMSTMILLVHNFEKNKTYVIALGDGVVAIDGELTVIYQNNQPDYMAYHLDQDFDDWYDRQDYVYSAVDALDVAIATDGVDSFMLTDREREEEVIPMDYLLADLTFIDKQSMLEGKFHKLINEYGFRLNDDLAVIRLRF